MEGSQRNKLCVPVQEKQHQHIILMLLLLVAHVPLTARLYNDFERTDPNKFADVGTGDQPESYHFGLYHWKAADNQL